ncbi:MAG: hypothetical protein U5K37_03265 [Natrialbaceae archaeon]|nr:hypothetical protein [Natrialbaceae archaeon]
MDEQGAGIDTEGKHRHRTGSEPEENQGPEAHLQEADLNLECRGEQIAAEPGTD